MSYHGYDPESEAVNDAITKGAAKLLAQERMPPCPVCGERELAFLKRQLWCHHCGLREVFDSPRDLFRTLVLLEKGYWTYGMAGRGAADGAA